MTRKVLGVGLFCVLLLAAIVAGYWDMLNTEKMTVVRDTETNAVGEIADIVNSKTASDPEVAASPPAPGSPAVDAASGPAATEAATASAADTTKGARVDPLPAFDVLRVEPDGSTVLAGTAPAGATVSLLDGATTLGTEVADASGAFVVVLDQPLAVGDHQIQIVAKTVDGRAVTSAETAIVSIPEKGRENELLAMVESPDKASRLISVPSAAPVPAAGTSAAGQASAAASPSGEEASPPPEAPSAPDASVTPAPQLATATPAATAAVPAGPSAKDVLSVDAVEIEDRSVFVAGRAVGSETVRIYVDNRFLAAADRLPDDRFLMTAKADIAAGDHTVRADALDKDGVVVARVEVPFVKPEGRTMSAVSSAPTAAADPSAPAGAPAAPAVAPSGSAEASRPASIAEVPPAATAAEPAVAEEAAAVPEVAAQATTPGAGAAAGSPVADATSTDVAVVRQPALEGVNSRVIIRRGDSLWRISRNTYGRGARYTVIYLANGDQIRDPNRIYPGQVFRMPKDEPVAQ